MRLPLCLMTGIVLLDQGTKFLVQRMLSLGDSRIVVDPVLDICHVWNTGAAWGMFAGRRALLVSVSVGVGVLLLASRKHFLSAGRLGRWALGLLLGGIVGNLIDRAFRGSVVDFIHVHWARVWDFPAFNIADSAICIGFALYALLTFLEARHKDSSVNAEIASEKE